MKDDRPRLSIPLIDNGDGRVWKGFMQSWIQAFHGRDIELIPITGSDNSINRNMAASAFLAGSRDYLLFLDADHLFTRADIDRMDASTLPILCGLYAMKTPELQYCAVRLPGEKKAQDGVVVEVVRAGTGCMRIHRSVFEALKPHVKPYRSHGGGWQFFKTDLNERGDLATEDFNFCELARKHGFKVMLDQTIQIGHLGNAVFPLPGAVQRHTT